MRKNIAKTAALVLAAMMAGSAVPMNSAALSVSGSSSTSAESDVELKAAIATVKKRISIPEELSEFDYSTSMSYGTKVFNFRWYKPEKSVHSVDSHSIYVTIVGDIITSYSEDIGNKNYLGNSSFAKLSESQMLEKAKSYIAMLDPDIKDKVTVSMGNDLSINSDRATINFQRSENGIPVPANNGTVVIDKNTGELVSFGANWWGNAKFDDPSKARSKDEMKEIYKKLCKLTPYYRIFTNWTTKEKTVNIVYSPDMTEEIDAFTGKRSAIWEDMQEAGGTSSYYGYLEEAEGETEDAAEVPATGIGMDEPVEFTKAELEKIQTDNSLISPEKAFEQLKKDKYAALTDDYVIRRYDIYSESLYDEVQPLSSGGKKSEEEEKFFLEINFTVKDELKNDYKGYKNVSVQLDARTGEMIWLNRSGRSGELPKLDVTKAKATADGAASKYAKNIINSYKSDKSNTDPVSVWGDKEQYYETSRTFRYNRYVNGIVVSGDNIYVTVDSEGTVSGYSFSHTENVEFPAADILSAEEAFEKLYSQRDLDYYYNGWITKDGQVKTYLLYQMEDFYLNAKTGKISGWYGDEAASYKSGRDVKYTDIKGIPQETAILTLQRHGVTISAEAKFRPNDYIEKNEFSALLNAALGRYYYYDEAVVEVPVKPVEAPVEVSSQSASAKTEKESQYVTREAAAVLFTKSSGFGNVSQLKGIFKTPFSDVKSTDENIGSIAVAYSMGFIKGEDGKLNGTKKITRAEAMQMIYDYILYKETNS